MWWLPPVGIKEMLWPDKVALSPPRSLTLSSSPAPELRWVAIAQVGHSQVGGLHTPHLGIHPLGPGGGQQPVGWPHLLAARVL